VQGIVKKSNLADFQNPAAGMNRTGGGLVFTLRGFV